MRAIVAGLVMLGTVTLQAHADEPAPSCPIKFFRAEEDCRNLAGVELSGIEALRYIQLTPDLSVSLGGELRTYYEDITAPTFDIRRPPTSHAVGYRGLLDADFRTALGPRVFIQLISAEERGREPIERPFDRDALDVQQGFLEVPTEIGDVPVMLRAGRQELDLAGNRLVAARDLANVRINFNLALVEAKPAGFVVDIFGGRPVLSNRGLFNDGANPRESFTGITVEHPVFQELGANMAAGVFAFRRTRALVTYADGSAPDERYTVGARLHGSAGDYDLALQGALQRGSFGSLSIDATGIAIDTGWRFSNFWGAPRVALSGGRASGDGRRGDGKLGTFDPLYPNLSYFTDASPIFPGNDWDLEPNVTFTLARGLTLQTGVDMLWRLSKQDAVYIPPGIPLIPGNGLGSDREVSLPYAHLVWVPDAHWQFELSYVAILPASLLRQAGAQTTHFIRTTATARF